MPAPSVVPGTPSVPHQVQRRPVQAYLVASVRKVNVMFKEILETIIERTEGSLGALIMGIDGIAVERSLKQAGQEANLDVAAAEFTSLVRKCTARRKRHRTRQSARTGYLA